MNIIINHIINKIIDVRMKNRIIEYINNIMNNNGTITLYPHIVIKNKHNKLIIKKTKNHISYIYNNKEKYEIHKIEKDYISEYKTKNQKQISVFKKEQEVIRHIEKLQKETTYLRTHNNNIILIEKDKNDIKHYIGLNEKKYENYIPENTIFTEIEEEDYINLISEKIEEEKILKKYCIPIKKLHLQ